MRLYVCESFENCKVLHNLKNLSFSIFFFLKEDIYTSLVAQRVRLLPTMRESRVWSLGWEDPLEKEMATHSHVLAWKIPWMKEPGRLQSMGLKRVGHDWATSLHFTSFRIFHSIFFFKGSHLEIKCASWEPHSCHQGDELQEGGESEGRWLRRKGNIDPQLRQNWWPAAPTWSIQGSPKTTR